MISRWLLIGGVLLTPLSVRGQARTSTDSQSVSRVGPVNSVTLSCSGDAPPGYLCEGFMQVVPFRGRMNIQDAKDRTQPLVFERSYSGIHELQSDSLVIYAREFAATMKGWGGSIPGASGIHLSLRFWDGRRYECENGECQGP